MFIDTLPYDIWDRIFKDHCSIKDLATLKSSCTFFDGLIQRKHFFFAFIKTLHNENFIHPLTLKLDALFTNEWTLSYIKKHLPKKIIGELYINAHRQNNQKVMDFINENYNLQKIDYNGYTNIKDYVEYISHVKVNILKKARNE